MGEPVTLIYVKMTAVWTEFGANNRAPVYTDGNVAGFGNSFLPQGEIHYGFR